MGIGDFAGRLKNFFGIRSAVSEELFEDLADLLVEGDFGAAEAFAMADKLRDYARKEKIVDAEELRRALALLLEGVLGEARKPGTLEGGALGIILLLGVNGVGKTTTAAKLACRLRDTEGRKPLL
ncbi:MAG: signal recognition particle-docking protein FtsY, partial [Treponema sp.]|nr:signal recognition particle-docking protein FtsY [Treponema sp.]